MFAKMGMLCLDRYWGRVVKRTGFLDLCDAGDPATVAARYEEECAGEIFPTSMDADRTTDGYGLEMVRAVGVSLVAGGKDGRPEHLAGAILRSEAEVALAASIFHFGEYSIRQTKQRKRDRGIPLRL